MRNRRALVIPVKIKTITKLTSQGCTLNLNHSNIQLIIQHRCTFCNKFQLLRHILYSQYAGNSPIKICQNQIQQLNLIPLLSLLRQLRIKVFIYSLLCQCYLSQVEQPQITTINPSILTLTVAERPDFKIFHTEVIFWFNK